MVSLARTLSADLLERRIRVNAISPGPVETPAFGKLDAPEAAARSHQFICRTWCR
ncbi:MAG: SDR family oxidoreductase [Hymenobacter sp.]